MIIDVKKLDRFLSLMRERLLEAVEDGGYVVCERVIDQGVRIIEGEDTLVQVSRWTIKVGEPT